MSTQAQPVREYSPGESLELAGVRWQVTRPRPFVLVIERGFIAGDVTRPVPEDYLHEILLCEDSCETFYSLVDATGLVICKNVRTSHSSYRDVRGRSSHGRLSQGEYYHHDGCSGPTKPRFVEIRCPHQDFLRLVATAVAPFRAILPAMVAALPSSLAPKILGLPLTQALLAGESLERSALDQLQGLVTRLVRKELLAEDARAYFREVDRRCDAYAQPWEFGESRFIANSNAGETMQHRRAHQIVNWGGTPSGSLLKRWPAEELLSAGQMVSEETAALIACEGDSFCARGDVNSEL